MRSILRLHALLGLVLCPIVTAAAQTSQSQANLYDYYDYANYYYGYYGYSFPCAANSGQVLGSSSSSCSSRMTGGAGSAYSSSFNASRSVSATSTLTQSGSGGQMSGYATANSTQSNSIFVNGTSGIGDNLVFHFQTSRAFGFLGTAGGSMLSFYQLTLGSVTGSAQTGGYDYPAAPHLDFGYRSTGTATGVDMSVPFALFSGTFTYDFTSVVETFHNNDQYSGAYGSSVFGATLTGIDAVDAQGNWIASAQFEASGNANIAVAPEPATLTLFGSGFALLAGASVVRRRRA